MSELAYHIEELEIVRTPGDPRRIVPVLPERFKSILDLGCGIGQSLVACDLKPETFACGVDIDAESLIFGKELSPHIYFVRACGERLPFPDHSFEVVISRVALPYTHLPTTLQEIARVLKSNGYVWFTLHPLSNLWEDVIGTFRSGNVKRCVYVIYVLLNGFWFHLSGKQFRYPLNRNRCESFQTVSGIKKALHKVGFEQVRTERDHFFVVTATLCNKE